MTDHVITLERPLMFRDQRAYFQARCSCGWLTYPTYTSVHQRKSAQNHLDREYGQALYVALGNAADRDEKLSISEWRAANPKPTLPF